MMKRSSKWLVLALVAVTLHAVGGTSLYGQSQTQSQAPPPVRSRAEETLEWWNQIGNKLIAMAKDFPEDKYDFKVQKDQRTFAQNLLHVAAIDYYLISKVSGTKAGPDFTTAPTTWCRRSHGSKLGKTPKDGPPKSIFRN